MSASRLNLKRVDILCPLTSYDFVKIKLASCHLLLYVVYMRQKFLNFIDAFNCYKQKSKLAPFNLAHPVSFMGLSVLDLGQVTR